MLTACASIRIHSFLPSLRARVEAKSGARAGKEGIRERIITHSLSSTYIFPKMNSFPRHLLKDASLAKMRGNEYPPKMHLSEDSGPRTGVATPTSDEITARQDGAIANGSPASDDVTILRHCRCMDCRNFSRADGQYFCSEYIGGTFSVWATGQRICEPAPEAWHYCSHYNGPQISDDVWVWRKATPTSHHVGDDATKQRPAPGVGRPGDGPTAAQPVGGEPVEQSNCTRSERPRPPTTHHVGAGSNISRESEQPGEDEVLL